MLKIELRPGESVSIGGIAVVTLEEKSGKVARLSIEADKSVKVTRVANTVMNAALGYAINNTSVTYSGAVPIVDTSCISPPPVGANRLDIGSRGGSAQANSCIKRIAYYSKRLSDAQLQQLTR